MQIIKESCSVCWRDFSSTIKPFSLICGHSYCYDCSVLLKKCPLCRVRLVQNGSRPTNYALLSLIEKAENITLPEMRDQHIQTEEVQHIVMSTRPNDANNTSLAPRPSKQKKKDTLKFKFTRGITGILEGFEIQMA